LDGQWHKIPLKVRNRENKLIIALLCAILVLSFAGARIANGETSFAKLWEARRTIPLAAKDGVLVASWPNMENQTLFACFDSKTGKQLWKESKKEPVNWDAIRADNFQFEGDRLFVLQREGDKYSFNCFSANNGKQIWSLGMLDDINPEKMPFVDGNNFYLIQHGIIQCFDSGNGQLLWKAGTGSGSLKRLAGTYKGLQFWTGNHVMCLDLKTKSQLWATPQNDCPLAPNNLDGILGNTPCFVGDYIFFLGHDCDVAGGLSIFCRNIFTGKTKAKLDRPFGMVATKEFFISIISTGQGNFSMYAFDPESGTKVWETRVERTVREFMFPLGDRFIRTKFGENQTTLAVLCDAKTGREISTTNLGEGVTNIIQDGDLLFVESKNKTACYKISG